jgi:hypothetical protein
MLKAISIIWIKQNDSMLLGSINSKDGTVMLDIRVVSLENQTEKSKEVTVVMMNHWAI